MSESIVPRVLLSGTRSGVGKTLLGIGLTHELRRLGVGVSCAVIGSNLIQAIIYKRISGRYTRCLDGKLLSASQLLSTVVHAGVGADLVIIQGSDGLYDGSGPDSIRGSDAELASLTNTPVVLIADARGYEASIAAVVAGYSEFARGFQLKGAILNRVDTESEGAQDEKEFFNRAFDAFGLPAPIGVVPELEFGISLPPMSLSQEGNKASLPWQFFQDLGQAIKQHVDIDRLLAIANSAKNLGTQDKFITPSRRRCRIAVSDDSCFNICFQDNLDLMRYFGAEIVTFSPLADSNLPKNIGGIYLTGAYLSEYGSEVANNNSLKRAISDFARSGGVVYSEGAGSAYLCKEFTPSGGEEKYPGVGLLSGSAISQKQEPAYTEAVTMEESIFGRSGLIFKGISTGEWKISDDERLLKVLRFSNIDRKASYEGYSPGAQILSTFSFAHFGSNPLIIKNFIEAAQIVKGL